MLESHPVIDIVAVGVKPQRTPRGPKNERASGEQKVLLDVIVTAPLQYATDVICKASLASGRVTSGGQRIVSHLTRRCSVAPPAAALDGSLFHRHTPHAVLASTPGALHVQKACLGEGDDDDAGRGRKEVEQDHELPYAMLEAMGYVYI